MISFSFLIIFLQDNSSEFQGEVTGQSLLGMKKLRPLILSTWSDFLSSGAFDQLKQNATKARIPFYGR